MPPVVCEACGLSHPSELAFSIRGYQIARCRECRLLSTLIPLGFDPRSIYSDAYFEGGVPDGYYDYLGSEEYLTAEYLSRANLVRDFVPSGRLLEVGCATGGFLQQARRFYSVQGIDVSQFAIDAARAKGLDVECAALEDSSLTCPPYDAIVLFDTVEHLPSPARSLTIARDLLRPGGHVVITTGDAQSLLARALGRRWRLLTPPQHLWFFGRESLTRLLTRLGFEVVAVRYLWRRVPLSLVWYQLFRGAARPLPTLIGRLVLPLNLFDTMTVVARTP